MPEHTPAPTPARAVYGFAVFLLFKTLFFLYVIWAYVPRKYLEDFLGLRVPDKYFAQALPIVIIFAIWLFAFAIYPMMGLSLTKDIDSIHTIRDEYTIRICAYIDPKGCKCKRKVTLIQGAERFCARHLNNEVEDEGVDVGTVSNYCDCPSDENCLLRTNSDYLTQMRLRKRVPAAYDLDIADISRSLYKT